MKKYVILIAAIVMHLCLGGIYAWSVFAPALIREFGYSAAQTQAAFGFAVAILACASMFGGRLQDLFGPRIPAVLSGILIGAGYTVAGFFGDHFLGILVGIGLLCGLGVAFGYISAIASVAKWFPGRRGFATGLVVSGYGSAAILLSALAGVLLARNWSPLAIFRLVGLIYGPTILLAGLLLSVPPEPNAKTQVLNFQRASLLRDRRFWRLIAGMAGGTYPGLALIGALKPIGIWQGFDLLTATASISALAIGNGSGRIAWGLIHDRMRSRSTVLLLMAAIIASILLFAMGGCGKPLFLTATFLVGFCYGGCLAVFPAEVAAIYGVNLMGSVYPFVLISHGLAALVAAPLTGLGVDLTGGYWPGIGLALAMAVTGFVLCSHLAEKTDSAVDTPHQG